MSFLAPAILLPPMSSPFLLHLLLPELPLWLPLSTLVLSLQLLLLLFRPLVLIEIADRPARQRPSAPHAHLVMGRFLSHGMHATRMALWLYDYRYVIHGYLHVFIVKQIYALRQCW